MAWKNFQNGYPLYASELNNYLMNQAVVVFASAAERASVLTAPVEGMVTWLQDTNVFQVWNGSAWTDINDNTAYIPKSTVTTAGDLIVANGSASVSRLGIGTNGQALLSNGTTAIWGTPASGGMTLISTTTLSGASTVLSSLPQTYKSLYAVVRNFMPSTDGSQLWLRLNGDANTRYALVSGTSASNTSFLYTNMYISEGQDNPTSQSFGELTLPDYTNTTTWKSVVSNYVTNFAADANKINAGRYINYYNQTGAITSMTFLSSSGNLASGTVLLYGVN